MRTQWELFTKADGSIGVTFSDGRMLTVSPDGVEGYDFAIDYLRSLSSNYKNHLRAADLLLREHIGVKAVDCMRRTAPNIYNAQLAIQSMHCMFGVMDNIPDCDDQGALNPEFVPCPCRATCKYNGYRHRDKDIVCCNPIHETGLTPRKRELADLLVNTSYTNADISTAMGCSTKNVENMASEVYAAMNVSNRQELTLLLKNKRIK